MRIDWTPELIGRLSDLWSTGATASAIAREFGTSRNAILGKARRLDLPARVITATDKRAVSARPQRIMADIAPKPLPERKEKPARTRIIYAADGEREMQTVGRPMIGAPSTACRWPIDGVLPRLCCSAPTLPGHSWCRSRAGIVYARPRGHVLRSDGGTTISDMRAAG